MAHRFLQIKFFKNFGVYPLNGQCLYTSQKPPLGIIHILRNHQGGGGFRNDYANVIFALSSAEFDYGRGRGSRNRQKVIT